MKPALRILKPGLLTTVQDLGRVGHQRLGVPVGGALDPVSVRAANALVGNAPGAGVLEVACMGPTFAIEADDVRLSFVGAAAAIDILADAAATSGTRIDAMRSIRLRRGQVVRIGALTDGAVLYVAVEGGFDIPPVLGSVSTYIRGGLGGWQGRAMVAGDEIPLCRASASDREERRLEGLDLTPPKRFRVIAGPQNDYFSDRDIAAFFEGEYTVSASDRMGMRLSGRQTRTCPRLQHNLGRHRPWLDPGAGKRPADRAARRSPDDRRLSEDRDRRLGGPARTRTAADRRQDRLRTRHP